MSFDLKLTRPQTLLFKSVKDHGKSYISFRPSLIRHLWPYCLLKAQNNIFSYFISKTCTFLHWKKVKNSTICKINEQLVEF